MAAIKISKVFKWFGQRKRATYKERHVKSGHEGDAVQEEANVTADNTELRLEWQFIQGVSLYHPAMAETDMGKTDAAPDKEV